MLSLELSGEGRVPVSHWHSALARGKEATACWRLLLALMASILCFFFFFLLLRLRDVVSKLVKRKFSGGGEGREISPGNTATFREYRDVRHG